MVVDNPERRVKFHVHLILAADFSYAELLEHT